MAESNWPMAERMVRLAREVSSDTEEQPTLQRIVDLAVKTVPGASSCGLSLRRGKGVVQTPACTAEAVLQADGLQYELDDGPCLNAIRHDEVSLISDLSTDEQWPTWSSAVHQRLGFRSVLSVRLATTDATLGALNLYSTSYAAFDDNAIDVAHIYAEHAAIALAAAQQVTHLQTALQSRHIIGVAQGKLMQRYDLSLEAAFAVLARHSSYANIPVRDLARQIVDTGELPEPPKR